MADQRFIDGVHKRARPKGALEVRDGKPMLVRERRRFKPTPKPTISKTKKKTEQTWIAATLGVFLLSFLGVMAAFVVSEYMTDETDPNVGSFATSTSSPTANEEPLEPFEQASLETHPVDIKMPIEQEPKVVEVPSEPEPTPAPKPVASNVAKITVETCDLIRNSYPIYADPITQVDQLEKRLRATDPETAEILREISCMPQVTWLVGGELNATWESVRSYVTAAEATNKIPVFVLYNLPDTNRAEWHSNIIGGGYYEWIGTVADAIGEGDAWVVLEPDALITTLNYSETERLDRLNQLKAAVEIFVEKSPNAKVYIDAGHSKWASVDQVVDLLSQAGIEQAHGFSLNVSNYHYSYTQISYGKQIGARLGDKHFIVDTSRNGIGPTDDFEWCNAPGRALGSAPIFDSDEPLLDALLWIKPPGESDGWCNGGPQAGEFWLEYAIDLVKNRPQ